MTPIRQTTTRDWLAPLAAFAALVYVPLLLTAPGTVVADTKSYLYLDPARLLSRAVSMWDPHVGLGTVPHQQIGYLWPAGPYYWLLDVIGVPDWIAQRLWIGTIVVAANAGVLYLCRSWRWRPSAAVGAAFVYALTPFVLTLAARISVLLLPFAGLPWLLAFTVRSLHTRGWRYPALFALTVTTIGSVNATSVLLIGLGPALWVVYSVVVSKDVTRPRAANTVTKLALLTIPVNLWWIGGLSVQATNGIDVLRYTETAQVVADSSSAPELLRGLGYWFFYGGDRLGPWIEPSSEYTQRLWLIGLTYAIPAIGLLALGVVRWRHRKFLVGSVLLGTVVGVGAHPWHDPSPAGRLIKAFLLTDVGLAMRSLPRITPLIALAVALAIGSLVGALAEQQPRRGLLGAIAVAAMAFAALPPLWTRGFVPENLSRPEALPSYWVDAAAALDAADHGTRILELPGTDFASYRWGNTVDPITPGLVDRPYVARELIPYGSPASAELLNALDLEFQEQTMSTRGLAAVARLMGVGDIVLRNDLQYERYNTPRPRSLWDLVRAMPGLEPPTTFGDGVPNEPVAAAPLLDENHLARDGSLPESPAVAVFGVTDPVPIVHAAVADHEVLLSGNGDGIVDAAMAGLLSGDELVRYSATVSDDPEFVRTQLTGDRALIVTDTNRRRGERWTTVRHTAGYTEQADGGLLRTDRTDNRLPVLHDDPRVQTVSEHSGLSVRATGYGNPITYTPEERPSRAADGDTTTAWRVAAFEDAVGHRLELTADDPVTTDHVTLLQPQTGEINRWITEIVLRFDGRDAQHVTLDASSRSGSGQRIDFPERAFTELSLEIRADTAGRRPGYGGLTSVGFAEVSVGDLHTDEVIRMPSDLLDAGGYRTLRYPLAIVQTRMRSVATEVTRTDEEYGMERALRLPTERDYAVLGTARLSTRAPSGVLDALLGRTGTTGGQPAVTATATLPGGLAHLPSNVLDHDPATVWTSPFGSAAGTALTVVAPTAVAIDQIALTVVDDAEHSVPAAVRVRADGTELGTFPVSFAPDGEDRATATVRFGAEVTFSTLDVEIADITPRSTINWYGGQPQVLPVAVAELSIGGLAVPPVSPTVDSGCRSDLVAVDAGPVPIRIAGQTVDALAGRGLAISGCDGGVTIPGGDHRFSTAQGRVTGVDIDQLVWRSAAGGASAPIDTPLLAPPTVTAPALEVVEDDAATVEMQVRNAAPGDPFWVVFGQSFNDGWELTVDDATVDGPHLVNGFANGYLVTPETTDLSATLRFVPQNRVEVAMLVSLFAALASLALALLPAREVRPLPIPRQEPLRSIRALTYEGALPTVREARLMGIGAGLAAAFLATPIVGLAVGIIAGFATRRETWRPLLTLLPAGLLTAVGGYVVAVQWRNGIEPGLHWPHDTGRLHPLGLAAVILLAVDVAIDELWARRSDFR